MPDANNNFKGSGWSRAREDGWEKAFALPTDRYTWGHLLRDRPKRLLGSQVMDLSLLPYESPLPDAVNVRGGELRYLRTGLSEYTRADLVSEERS